MLKRWMVRVVAMVMWGGAVASALAAERPNWYPAEDVVAAQQARITAKRQAAMAYYQREFIGSYERVGRHSPKWDAAMQAVLQAVIADRIGGNPDSTMLRMAAINRAAPLQIQDPLYGYFWALGARATAAPPQEVRRVTAIAAPALAQSAYSPILRYHAMIRYAEVQASDLPGDLDRPDVAACEATLKKALALLEEAAKAKDMPLCEMFTVLRTAQDGSRAVYHDRWRWTQQVYDVLVKHYGQTADLQAAKGDIHVSYAWDARGTGFANTVTEEGWKLMRERLAIAEKELTAAWNKDNQCVTAALSMLSVEKGQGKGRDVMEMWFRRAIAADAMSGQAYEFKLDYLAAKWHGSDEESLAFAREVAATLPKTSYLRLLLWTAYNEILCQHTPNHAAEQAAYLQAHPEVWAEVKAIADDVCLAKDAPLTKRLEMAFTAVAVEDTATARSYVAGINDMDGIGLMGHQWQAMKQNLAALERRPARKNEAKKDDGKVTFP